MLNNLFKFYIFFLIIYVRIKHLCVGTRVDFDCQGRGGVKGGFINNYINTTTIEYNIHNVKLHIIIRQIITTRS